MGGLFSKVFGKLFGKKEVRILMLGLNNAGKTTILYKLNLGDFIQVAPTTAFNVETVEHKNIKFQVWDLAGQKGIRPYWRSYYPDTKAVIFVIDSTDKDKLATAKEELLLILEEEELKGVPVLVFANKQDLPNPLDQGQIIQEMGLTNTKNRQWAVYACSALNGNGIEEGMNWMVETINQEENK